MIFFLLLFYPPRFTFFFSSSSSFLFLHSIGLWALLYLFFLLFGRIAFSCVYRLRISRVSVALLYLPLPSLPPPVVGFDVPFIPCVLLFFFFLFLSFFSIFLHFDRCFAFMRYGKLPWIQGGAMRLLFKSTRTTLIPRVIAIINIAPDHERWSSGTSFGRVWAWEDVLGLAFCFYFHYTHCSAKCLIVSIARCIA